MESRFLNVGWLAALFTLATAFPAASGAMATGGDGCLIVYAQGATSNSCGLAFNAVDNQPYTYTGAVLLYPRVSQGFTMTVASSDTTVCGGTQNFATFTSTNPVVSIPSYKPISCIPALHSGEVASFTATFQSADPGSYWAVAVCQQASPAGSSSVCVNNILKNECLIAQDKLGQALGCETIT